MPRHSPRKKVSSSFSPCTRKVPHRKSKESPTKQVTKSPKIALDNKDTSPNKKSTKDLDIPKENTKNKTITRNSPTTKSIPTTYKDTETENKNEKATPKKQSDLKKRKNPFTKEPAAKRIKKDEQDNKKDDVKTKEKPNSRVKKKNLDTCILNKSPPPRKSKNSDRIKEITDLSQKNEIYIVKHEIVSDLSKKENKLNTKSGTTVSKNLSPKRSIKTSNERLKAPKSPRKPRGKRKKREESVDDQEKAPQSLLRVDNEYIAEGFKDDCEIFIQKCGTVSKLNFEKFSVIWKSMGFANIYKGRLTGAETAELSDEVIHVAKTYMLAADRTFEVNVAGLFLVYGLLNLQPYKDFSALRLVPKDVPAILALEAEARKQKRHDIIYVLGHILTIGPCQFHVLARECGIEQPIRKYFDGSIVVNDATTQPIGVLSHNNEALSLIKNLTFLDHKYHEAKKLLQDRAGADPSLNFTSFTADELEESIQDLIPSFLRGKRKSKGSEEKREEREHRVKSIKDKAMSHVVSPMKHLSGVNERKKQSPSTPTTSKTESKRKILKGSFSARSITTDPQFETDEQVQKNLLEMSKDELEEINASDLYYRKRNTYSKFAKAQKKKRYNDLKKYIENDKQPEELNDIYNTVNNMPVLLGDNEPTVPENNLSLPNIFEDNIGRSFEVEIENVDKNNSHATENLTVVDKTGQGIQVETIDLYKPKTKLAEKTIEKKVSTEKHVEKKDGEDKTVKKKHVEKKNVENENEEQYMNSDSSEEHSSSEQNTVATKNRRNLKRTRVKSALSRLGILDVADFETEE